MKSPVSARSAILRTLDAEGIKLKASDITKSLQDQGMGFQKGNIYPALDKLNTDGLVKHSRELSEDTGRECSFWALTAKGKKTAAREREAVNKLYGE